MDNNDTMYKFSHVWDVDRCEERDRERERNDYEKYNVTTVVMEWIKSGHRRVKTSVKVARTRGKRRRRTLPSKHYRARIPATLSIELSKQ